MTDVGAPRRVRDRTRLSPLRRITIRRLEEARAAAVPVTVLTEADGARLAELRGRVNLTAVLAALLVRTLVEHPDVNCGLDGDDLVRFEDVNLGIAVALPDGNLTVPVVPRAQELDVAGLARAIGDLAARARDGALALADVRGGTVTLSNVGMMLPAAWGTPLIPPGQTAIVLTGGLVERPVVRDGAVVPGRVLPISLSFDHRVVNGEGALRFLRAFVAAVETGGGDAT